MQAHAKESICKETFAKLCNKIQYFGSNSSLHGVGYVCSLSFIPFFKRIFWLSILILCCLGASSVLQGALGLYSGDLVSYSVETDYLKWETPFPAVTVCENYDAVRMKSVLTREKLSTNLAMFVKETCFYSVSYCGRLCSTCKPGSCMADFQQLTHKLRLNCSQLLTDCSWGGENFYCCDRFLPLETEYGTCYTFNSQLTSKDKQLLKISRRAGLPDLLFATPYSVLLRLHAPDEAVSASMDNVLGRVNSLLTQPTDFEAIIKAEQTVSDVSMRSVEQSLRGCLYHHERPAFAHLWPFTDYTYSTCIYYCRAIEQMELCNCTHHFMPKLKGVATCDIHGMFCLYENSKELLTVDCKCPMGCEEILYKVTHIFNGQRDKKQGSRVRVRFVQQPSLRVRRQTIRGVLGLVVDIGGVGGVFFGASLLSVVEIVYLLCIRRGST
ncbi:sodium channel protein Nach-like [Pectinophora gossypiella]|uniref:sodium channel protein Nach-like n=1 Tax=Pectinophora gossypiella TaxID=13191 RepID=UPI00214EC89A|nr:sodium channel protein Nach-like [Pectinophora gossypiella]